MDIKVKGIQCMEPECRQIFRNKTRLYYHQINKHPGSTYHINCSCKCPICLKVFKTKQLMGDHFRRVHSCKGKQSQLCRYCNKHFKNKDSLRNHIFRIHKQKKHKCEECNKVFMKESSLVSHKCIQYECKWCDKVYKSCSSLSRHVKTHHMYCCLFCPSSTDIILYQYDKLLVHCKSVHNLL